MTSRRSRRARKNGDLEFLSSAKGVEDGRSTAVTQPILAFAKPTE
jgi:hypothetical protein